MPHYASLVRVGLTKVASLGDGYTINLKYWQAFADGYTNQIAYHIYYSTIRENVFLEGVKLVVIDGSTEVNVIGLNPGQEYFFSVRPVEYNPKQFNLSLLPISHDNVRFYPSSLLRQNMSATDLIVPLMDVESFPSVGIVKVGVELIQYVAVDPVNNNLIVSSNGRGWSNTHITIHYINGSDGYVIWNAEVSLFTLTESTIYDQIYVCMARFEYPNFPFTMIDGYKQVTTDILTTDYNAADAANVDFPMYDYSGYHRTDPVQLLNGTCVGSYIGGEMGCIDAYGNYNIYRGFSLQDQNTQREDMLLSVTGQPAVLIKRVQTGDTCNCYLANSEYPDDRCPFCYGTKFVFGYDQYFNPRQSDGRIMVRLGPTAENLKMQEAGLESTFPLDIWTITVPTIKTRDILVLFDQNDNESFRYEVSDVIRNQTILGQDGGQHLKTFRIRKTDPAYQIRIFRNTSDFPNTLSTSIGMAAGAIPPHSHTIVVNEKVLAVSQLNQTTGISQGHSHPIVNGVVMEVLGHTHQIII